MRFVASLSVRRVTGGLRARAVAARWGRRRPTRPVRASSRIPCGRTSSSNDSISSGRPTSSKTIESGPSSATRALKSSPSAISSLRRSGGAATLISDELPLDRLVGRQLGDPQHVDELVHLLRDLLERVLAAVDAQREPRDVRAARSARPRGSRCCSRAARTAA